MNENYAYFEKLSVILIFQIPKSLSYLAHTLKPEGGLPDSRVSGNRERAPERASEAK